MKSRKRVEEKTACGYTVSTDGSERVVPKWGVSAREGTKTVAILVQHPVYGVYRDIQ